MPKPRLEVSIEDTAVGRSSNAKRSHLIGQMLALFLQGRVCVLFGLKCADLIVLLPDKPQFPSSDGNDDEERVFTVEEGSGLVIDLTAKANPEEVTYRWTNPDRATVPDARDALPDARCALNCSSIVVY